MHCLQWRIQDFPLRGIDLWRGGHRPLMLVLFGENACINERIGSCGGGMHQACPPDPPMVYVTIMTSQNKLNLPAGTDAVRSITHRAHWQIQGALPVCPHGTQFFCFQIHFCQKVPPPPPSNGKSWICHWSVTCSQKMTKL